MISKNWVKRKAHWAEFNYHDGTLLDSVGNMRIVPGKSNMYKKFKSESGDSAIYEFTSVNKFIKNAELTRGAFIPIHRDQWDKNDKWVYTDFILVGKEIRFGYSLRYLKVALKLVKNAEIGLPDKILPLVIRYEKITVLLAPYEVKENSGKIDDM
jgi:hypothetical protein